MPGRCRRLRHLYLPPTDPRVQLIEGLGFTVAPAVAELGAGADSTFFAQLARERAPEIDYDVIVGFADDLPAEEVAALPIYGRVPAIQDDAAVLIDDQGFGSAVSSISVLSLPFALDQLSAAAENAGG